MYMNAHVKFYRLGKLLQVNDTGKISDGQTNGIIDGGQTSRRGPM